MKIEAFQIEHHPPNLAVAQSRGHMREAHLTWVQHASPDPNITVGYEGTGHDLEFFIFHKDKCQGLITFDQFGGEMLGRRYQVDLHKLATPHALLAPAMQGKGITMFLYTAALKSGITLITDKHTEAAAGLWTKLSAKFNLYNVEEDGSVIPSATPTSVKLLTKYRYG